MTIEVKIVDAAKKVFTVTIKKDDPSDIDLILAFGGGTSDDIEFIGDVGEWSVIKLKGGTDRMVVGKPPQNSNPQKKRISCTLTDVEAANVAYHY